MLVDDVPARATIVDSHRGLGYDVVSVLPSATGLLFRLNSIGPMSF